MKPFYILCFLLFISCKNENKTIPPEYEMEISKHYKNLNNGRINYLELIGLHKLKNGDNTFGKSKDNTITLKTNVSEHIGNILKNDSVLELKFDTDVKVTTNNDVIANNQILILDEYGNSNTFYHNSIYWQIITRSGDLYLRVWDKSNPYVTTFKGFKTYPLNEDYIMNGKFEYFETAKTEEIETKLGKNTTTDFIGKVAFEINGSEHTLDVGTNGFTMVNDETSGSETYGGGRYIYLDLPKENGSVKIDFNKLYNPPCAFSEFTTCPLPPRQNVLPIELNAGEKYEKN